MVSVPLPPGGVMSMTPGTAPDTAWYATSSQAWVTGFSTWTAWTLLSLSPAVSPATPLTARVRLAALWAAATSSTSVLSTTLPLPFTVPLILAQPSRAKSILI